LHSNAEAFSFLGYS